REEGETARDPNLTAMDSRYAPFPPADVACRSPALPAARRARGAGICRCSDEAIQLRRRLLCLADRAVRSDSPARLAVPPAPPALQQRWLSLVAAGACPLPAASGGPAASRCDRGRRLR